MGISMIEKLVTITDEEQQQEHVENYGGYNSMPPGWTEITSDGLSKTDFFTYCFTKLEYRQFKDPDNNDGYQGFLDVRLFFMPAGHGYGMYRHREKMRYFRFGCVHNYVGLDQEECRRLGIPHYGRCYSVARCTKCGYTQGYDSSD